MLLSDSAVSNDEDVTDEAAAAFATVDAEFGRTTDPVRMYMREMGTVELLNREGEIRIAKRIEEGLDQVRGALLQFPPTVGALARGSTAVWRPATGRMQDCHSSASSTPTPTDRRPERAEIRTTTKRAEQDTGPDPEEVAAADEEGPPAFRRYLKALRTHGIKHSSAQKGHQGVERRSSWS